MKMFWKLCCLVSFGALASCSAPNSWWNNGEYEYVPLVDDKGASFNDENLTSGQVEGYMQNPDEAARVFNKRVPPLNSVIVCRDKQCAPTELFMAREYIFNSLAHLVDNNLDATALLCEANPQAHVCINSYLTVPAKIGVTPAYMFFDGVKIVDASAVKGKTAINLILGYNLSYNGQTPFVCKPDKAMMYVKGNNNIVLNGNGFKCDVTSVGTTTIRVMFDIDYIDLDYGYIGGYYSIGLSGPAMGGGSGYGLIRLPKDAQPLSPELMMKVDETDSKASQNSDKSVVKPDVKELPEEASDDKLKKEEETSEDEKIQNEKQDSKTSGLNDENKTEKDVALPNEQNVDNNSLENTEEQQYINPMQPIKITPDTIVKSDRVILKPEEPQEIRPFEVDSEEYEPKFEEIYVDDLDEYIK